MRPRLEAVPGGPIPLRGLLYPVHWSSLVTLSDAMSSRNRTRTSYGFNLGNVYSFGLNKSYGSALGSGGYSFSSGYSSGYSGGGGYGTSFLSRVMGGGGYSGYTSQNTPDVYKRSYTNDNIASGKNSINTESASSGHSSYGSSRSSSSSNRSARLYTSRAKTDSQLCSVLDSRRPSLSSWRSKSTDGNSSYSSRDSRSLSKDVYNNNTESSYDSFREPSLVKERSITRDYSSRAYTPSREYTPSRDYTPARDFARRDSSNFDSNPLPPPRMKKFGFHKSTNNLNEGTNWSGGKGNSGSGLTRSTSFHALQDFRTLQQQSRNSNSGYFNFRGLENPASDLTRTKSIANIFSPRSWRGSGTDLNTDSTSSSTKPLRLSSLISLTSPCSLSDLGYMSEGPSRRDSLAVSL